MDHIQTFDVSSKVVYDFFFKDGKLDRLRSKDYVTNKVIKDEYRNPNKYVEEVKTITNEHFKKAVDALCVDINSNPYEEFLESLKNDEEYLKIARYEFSMQISWMAEKINSMNKALWKI